MNDIKILLGNAVNNYSDELIDLTYKMTLSEIESYCNREIDTELDMIAKRITVIKLNHINNEGVSSISLNGISESYLDGYPNDIKMILNRKRKIKVV